MFRLTKPLVRVPPSRTSALDVETKVLTTLRFYASCSYQLDTASNKHFCMTQSSASRCINEVTEALNQDAVLNRWICFPRNMNELHDLRQHFYQRYGFPGVIGCIDCTDVAIVAPKENDAQHPEHIYVNRKNYHSINVQLICDHNLKILNVNARYPGRNLPDPEPEDEDLDLDIFQDRQNQDQHENQRINRVNPDLGAGRLIQRIIQNYFGN
ncbi:hypothetical protein ILUMI_14119 [Ignelater luminosus]|uniref:DDE Tnp4 domain-containing protein n=1 Tax=Ignelater luminosus TaxID=2038154 RepID=A0A8K0CT42_IGNLU|nr:hypothetical protein ILUMI_14119 [Ignelater luminosus]